MARVLDVAYQQRGLRSSLSNMTVIQRFGRHTLALLDYEITDKYEYILPKEHTPIKVRWGESPMGISTFYGYVNHYETGDEGSTFTRLVAIGTSKKMNNMVPTTWHNSTRSGIVRDIAKRYRMRSVVHPSEWVVEHWSTGPRTDWMALNDLAEEIGYCLWVDGSTVYFLDPHKVVKTSDSMFIPTLLTEGVDKFELFGGSNIPGVIPKSRRRVLYGLDYSTNDIFMVTSGDLKDPEEMIPAPISTYAEASRITGSASRREGEYFYARARVPGDATLRPGRVVRFDSTEESDRRGLWTVTEATHSVSTSGGDDTTTLVMTRGKDPLPLTRVTTTISGSGPEDAVVRDGETWEAMFQEHVNV